MYKTFLLYFIFSYQLSNINFFIDKIRFIIIQQIKMKLHYSTQGAANNRLRKIKAVATAVGVKLQQVAHQTSSDLTTISPFNTLPLLQTQEGTFFSSNTIVRYLANSQGKLYGDNLHSRALVDQWLDVSACDFEAAVAAVVVARDGKQVDVTKVAEDVHKFLKVLEGHLSGRKFLVGQSLTIADIAIAAGLSVVFTTFLGEEQRTAYPNLTAWYISVVATDNTIGSKDLPKEAHKAFKGKKPVKQQKKDEKKPTPAPAAEQDDDLFGQSTTPAVQAPKPKIEVKPKKQKPAAKSMIIFDVKVYEMQTDLLALFQRIKTEIVIDGLTWNNEPKIVPIAFGMNKLQCGCVVEDAKVSVDDIYEKIESWEDIVQSTDTVSFQKL